jgi:hypothetical protein
MTEQLICFDCGNQKAEYNAKREVYSEEEGEHIWKDVKVCKECKIKEHLQKLHLDYSFFTEYYSVKVNGTMYNFNLKKARLIQVEYDETNDTFLVHIEYTSNHKYIIVYDFDLNPIRVA